MSRSIIGGLFVLFILAGCTTPPEPNQVIEEHSVGSGDYRKLDAIELMILNFKAGKSLPALADAEQECLKLLESPTLNKEFEARLHGLYGEVLFYSGKTRAAGAEVNEVEMRSKKEPQLFILKALLETKPEEKVKFLEEGLRAAPASGKLALYLAEVYFSLGEYSKATGFYDDAFLRLNAAYKEYYREKRDLAKKFITNPPESQKTRDFIGIKELLVADVLKILLTQSPYLETVAPGKDVDLSVLLRKLKEEGFFYPPSLDLNSTIKRKDVAYLVLAIIARLENNPEIMHTYATQYKETSRDSPVPDIKVDDYYFDAVVNLVELEIMELPDGIHFFPDRTVSGLEFFEILKLLKQHYGQ